jgi:hypothetical protein
MTRLSTSILSLLLLATIATAQAEAPAHFRALDVYLNTGDKPLAAYQIELRDSAKRMNIVGIEGGGHAAFKKPPYYDPAAMMGERIVLAAFSTDKELPVGNVRVARIHVQIIGEGVPDIAATVKVAADEGGTKMPATVSILTGGKR